MDNQTLLAIGEGLIGILLAVNTFWTKKFITSVDNMAKAVAKMQTENAGQSASCVEKHRSINEKTVHCEQSLHSAHKAIGELKTDVAVLKEKICEKS